MFIRHLMTGQYSSELMCKELLQETGLDMLETDRCSCRPMNRSACSEQQITKKCTRAAVVSFSHFTKPFAAAG